MAMMEQEQIDWTRFRKRIMIKKSPGEIYSAWTTGEAMEKWFLEKAVFTDPGQNTRGAEESAQKGDMFTWKWHNWEIEEKGEVLAANGTDRISFTFGPGGIVHVIIKQVQGQSEVILTQEQIPGDEKSKMELFVGCATGWTFWLANLKAWMEHGITLHATGLSQEETKDLVNS
jgi:uncharacterized protein YndB with AHSA1/START domain